MNKYFALVTILVAIHVGGISRVSHSQFDPDYPEPLPPLEGTLFLHGGGAVDSAMRARFTQLAGGQDAHIVVIPTADLSDPLNAKKLDGWQEQLPNRAEFWIRKLRNLRTTGDFMKNIHFILD